MDRTGGPTGKVDSLPTSPPADLDESKLYNSLILDSVKFAHRMEAGEARAWRESIDGRRREEALQAREPQAAEPPVTTKRKRTNANRTDVWKDKTRAEKDHCNKLRQEWRANKKQEEVARLEARTQEEIEADEAKAEEARLQKQVARNLYLKNWRASNKQETQTAGAKAAARTASVATAAIATSKCF